MTDAPRSPGTAATDSTAPDRAAGGLRPVAVALARPVASMADVGVLPGGTAWEPKWDGVRVVVAADGAATTLTTREGRDVTAAFPELVAAVVAGVPAGTVLDGEAVVWRQDRLDFLAVQRRATARYGTAALAAYEPAQLVVLDVLRHRGEDLRPSPFVERRVVLEGLAAAWTPPLVLTTLTGDPAVAARWFRDLAASGVEGLVAKGLDQPYRGGRRDWCKVRHRCSVDLVAVGVSGPVAEPTAVHLALPADGALVPVGVTAPLSAVAAMALGRLLTPAGTSADAWGTAPRAPHAAGHRAPAPPARPGEGVTPVAPLVVEVSADLVWRRDALDHPAMYLRARPDLDPAEVEATLAYHRGRAPADPPLS